MTRSRSAAYLAMMWAFTAKAGLNCASAKGCLRPISSTPCPQNIQRSTVIERLADAVEKNGFRGGAVVLAQNLPGLRLRGLNPVEQIGGEQSPGAIVERGVAFRIKPAVSGKAVADFRLKTDFFVKVHAASLERSDGGFDKLVSGRLRSNAFVNIIYQINMHKPLALPFA